jgi:hypothetical protein
MKRTVLLCIFALLLAIPPAFAAPCSSPAEAEGTLIYNTDHHVYQFCNGTNWIGFNAIDPAGGGGGCSNPTAREAILFYNTDYHVLQYWTEHSGSLLAGSTSNTPGQPVRDTLFLQRRYTTAI